MACWFHRGVRGTMAAKSRSTRKLRAPGKRQLKKRQPKKRQPRKRIAGATAKTPRKRAAKPAQRNKPTQRNKPAQRKIKAAPRMVEAALASFAHEVRTPLTGILAISTLLATSDLPERERRWVDTIKAGAEHLASLATLFVDAARGGNAAAGVRQDFFDLRVLARNAGDSLAGRAAAKGLQSQVDLSAKLPALVIGRASC